MPASILVQRYARLLHGIKAMKEDKDTKKVIDRYEVLQEELRAVEQELRAVVAETTTPIELEDKKLTYIERFKKWIDYETASKLLTASQRAKLDLITKVTKEIDMEAFTTMCHTGIFPERTRVEAYREEKLKPQVREVAKAELDR